MDRLNAPEGWENPCGGVRGRRIAATVRWRQFLGSSVADGSATRCRYSGFSPVLTEHVDERSGTAYLLDRGPGLRVLEAAHEVLEFALVAE